MKLQAIAAAQAFYHINREYELMDIELDDYLVVHDFARDDIVIVKPVQLERPIVNSAEGLISRREFEKVVDYLLDVIEDVDMFFRFDIMHVYITKEDRALVRLHVNVSPYEEEEDE